MIELSREENIHLEVFSRHRALGFPESPKGDYQFRLAVRLDWMRHVIPQVCRYLRDKDDEVGVLFRDRRWRLPGDNPEIYDR